MPRSRQNVHRDVHAAGAFGFEPGALEYHLSHFVGWPRTPMAQPIIPLAEAPSSDRRAMREGATENGREYASRYDARANSEMLSTDFRREGLISATSWR